MSRCPKCRRRARRTARCRCGWAPVAGAEAARRTDPQAIASLVLGIASLIICPLIAGIIAIVLGNQAQARIRTDPTLEGEGLARAGVVLGWIGVVLAVLGLLFFFLV